MDLQAFKFLKISALKDGYFLLVRHELAEGE